LFLTVIFLGVDFGIVTGFFLFEAFSRAFNRDKSVLISSAAPPVDELPESVFFPTIKSLFLWIKLPLLFILRVK